MTDLYIGQNYSSQVNKNFNTSTGSPGASGDGIHWPYNPNGNTPNPSQFQINWNSPNAASQAEKAYEKLVEWLRNNPGCYNGYIMLLQMTVDIGEHLNQLPPTQQQDLSKFLSNELTSGKGESILAMIVKAAFEGAAMSQNGPSNGEAAAKAFLEQIMNACQGVKGLPPFSNISKEASTDLDQLPTWIQKHWKLIQSANNPQGEYMWVDHNGLPIASFSDFANMAAFSVGIELLGGKDGGGETINGYYHDEIAQLVAQFKGNPWALLIALMNLINGRDQDDGMAVNGYGANLNILKKANALVEELLGSLSGKQPDASKFFSALKQLRTLVEQDPALHGLVDQLKSDIDTIEGQKVTLDPGISDSWSVSAGVYHFPPGSHILVNGKPVTVGPSGEIYVSSPVTFTIVAPKGGLNLTFKQWAAMGNTNIIATTMGKWSTTVMSNFENSVTGVQTLLNGASPAIQQQIQAKTQTMQARENFEKQAFSSITTMTQQVMRMIQQVMG
jgi:hypothetical protein